MVAISPISNQSRAVSARQTSSREQPILKNLNEVQPNQNPARIIKDTVAVSEDAKQKASQAA